MPPQVTAATTAIANPPAIAPTTNRSGEPKPQSGDRLAPHGSVQTITLQSNEPFTPEARSIETREIETDPVAWQVQQGALAIFVRYPADNDLYGRRRHLLNVKAGELFFSAAGDVAEQPTQLLAIALESTELIPLTAADLLAQAQTEPEASRGRLEHWVDQLSHSLAGLTEPRRTVPIRCSGLLARAEAYRPPPGRVVWLQLLWGQAQWLSQAELRLPPSPVPLPLSGQAWIEATATAELNLVRPSAEASLAGLRQFHSLLFAQLYQQEFADWQRERQTFQARIELNQRAVGDTLTDFSQVLQPRRVRQVKTIPIASTVDEATLMAVGAVGKALGIEIQAPPEEAAEATAEGMSLDAIARASHIRRRAVTLEGQWWKQDGGPLLAYSREDHRPLALLPRSETTYDILDPMRGERRRCSQRLAATIEPSAYAFYRPLPDQVKPLSLARFILRGNLKELCIILLTGVAATLLGMVPPLLTGLLIDQAIPNANLRLLAQMALGLLAVTVGTTLFQLSQSIAVMRLETRADSDTQAAVWDRLLKLDAAFFRQYAIGDLSSRVSAVSQIRQKLGNTILKSLFSSLFSFLNLGLLFYYSPALAFVALLVAAVNIAVIISSSTMTLKKMRPLVEEQGKLFGMVVQLINGVSKFRIAGAEPRAYAYWGKQYSHQLRLLLGSEGIEDNLTVINSLLSALTPAVLFGTATALLQAAQAEDGTGSFTTGTFLAFNAAFGTFIGGATSLSSIVIDILEVWPIWQRAQPILQGAPEVSLARTNPGRLSGRLAVHHALFRYRPDGALNLDDVSIHAEPGEFIALVGPSGSGKSTLLRLILGFDTPESGLVSFDGQDLASLDVTAIRRQLGVVLQNSRLMSASIFDNIASSALISMDEAWDAARMAGFADDIAQMPMGMHTVVSEGGTNLSGGQRQRLLIARALALRPRILLFDEATSALDNRTQAIVSESLDRLKVTRIVVAHRLSTIRNADRIYVLEAGRVVEAGDFEALALQDGLFSQLIKRQQV